LENWVGTDLFVRTTHGVSLAPAGEQFKTQAAILTRALHQLRREALEASGRASAALTFAATHALSFTFFPGWIREKQKILPPGALNLISDSMEACEHVMLRGDAQFLLCHYHQNMRIRLERGQFASLVVGADTLVPLTAPNDSGSPRWSLDCGEPVRYLVYSAQSGLGRIISAWLANENHSFALDKVFTSHLAATLLSMVKAGEGVAWLPQTLAAEDIARGQLLIAQANR
jgi:LysR family transcriptional regulator, hypochlorite-specific transcription factor HypT